MMIFKNEFRSESGQIKKYRTFSNLRGYQPYFGLWLYAWSGCGWIGARQAEGLLPRSSRAPLAFSQSPYGLFFFSKTLFFFDFFGLSLLSRLWPADLACAGSY